MTAEYRNLLRQAIDQARRAQLVAADEPRFDYPRRAGNQRVDLARARRMRSQGFSYPQIARELGCTHQSVMYACDEEYRERKLARMDDYRRRRREFASSPSTVSV